MRPNYISISQDRNGSENSGDLVLHIHDDGDPGAVDEIVNGIFFDKVPDRVAVTLSKSNGSLRSHIMDDGTVTVYNLGVGRRSKAEYIRSSSDALEKARTDKDSQCDPRMISLLAYLPGGIVVRIQKPTSVRFPDISNLAYVTKMIKYISPLSENAKLRVAGGDPISRALLNFGLLIRRTSIMWHGVKTS